MAAPASALLTTRADKAKDKAAGTAAPAASQVDPPTPSRQVYPPFPALPANPASIPADAPSDGRGSEEGLAEESPPWLQSKLTVGASDDPLETEADKAADDVIRMEAPSGPARPAAPPQLRRAAANGAAGGVSAAPPIVHEALRSPGRPLDREIRAFMEPRFGRDLSDVRIHTGAQAAASAQAIQARAYTAGSQIVWDAGYYAPHTGAGQRLLAHELAHVVQQADLPQGGATTIRRQTAGAVLDAPPAPTQDAAQPADGDAAPKAKDAGSRGGQLQDKAQTNLPGLEQMGSKAAKIRDATKSEVQGKVEQALQPPAPGAGDTSGKEDDSGDGKSLAGLSTGNLALIDTELAEHQRWGEASTKVGAAGSGQRAEFIAESAAGGSNFLESLGKGAATGAGIKLLEKGAEKGALKLAAKFAPAVGKFAPLPAVGAVIGGVMSAYDLASRDWKATGETIGRFGQGADIYDTLANSIESISTIIDVATGVLNVIAGIIGAISIAMWIITILTVGIASPLAATLSTIAGGIGVASMVLDGINSLVLKQLITIFRSLHTFTSEADPRDVVTQGNAIGQAAGAATGFLGGLGGGLAGGALAEKGLHLASRKPTAKVPGHPTPGAGSGDGPSVKAEPPEGAAGSSPEVSGGEPATEAADAPRETAAPAETSLGIADAEPVTPEIPEVPEAPRSFEVTAVPDTPAIPETKGLPAEPEIPAKAAPASEAVAAAEKVAGTEAETAPDSETAPESSPEPEQGGGDDGNPKEKPLSKKEQARLKEKIRSGEDLTKEDIEKLAQHAGVSPEQMKAEINRAEIEGQGESRGLKDEDVPVASSDQKKPFLESGRDAEGNRFVEKLPGRPETPARVKSWARRTARRMAGRIIQAALQSGVDDAYTNRARAFLDAKQLEYIRKNGKLPKGVQFHHLFTVADFPEFAHLAEVGVPLSEEDHVQAGHGGDISKPIETPELLNEEALKHPSLSEDLEARKGVRMKKGPGVLVESKRQIGRHEAAARSLSEGANEARQEGKNKRAARLDAEAKDQENKAQLIRDALPKLEALLNSASDEARQDLGRPAKAPVPPTQPSAQPGAASGEPASTAAHGPETPPVPAPEAIQPHVPAKLPDGEDAAATARAAADLRAKAIAETPPIVKPEQVRKPERLKSGAPPTLAGSARQAEQPRPPASRRALAEPPAPSAVEETPADAAPTPAPGTPEQSAPKPASNLSHLPPAARLGANRPPGSNGQGEGKDEKEDGSGETAGGPIVEHVNPNYAPPPCTPQDIVDVKNDILETLDARAKSEDAATLMAGQEAHHKKNEKPLTDVQQRTDDAISATEAHKQAVDRRTQANGKKKENEDHASGTIADYANQAAQLSVITVPMRGFERFTSLADSLPDNEDSLSTLEDIVIGPVFDILIRAKRGIMKMNSDAKHFLEQLDSMDKTMEDQKGAQQDRSKQVAADASTLQETGKAAVESGDQLNKAQETSKDLDAKNKERITEAGNLHKEAARNAATLGTQATQKQGQVQNLSGDLEEWAQTHRQAREDSLEQTKANLEQQGYRIIAVKEL